MFNNAAITALGPALEPEMVAHLSDMTDTTNPVLNLALNELIRGLKTDGIWSKIEILSVIHDNAADSLLDLKRLQNATNNGCPFTAGSGFAKDGAGAYIDMNNAGAYGSMTHANGDFHWMMYRSDSSVDGTFDMGCGNTIASPTQTCIFQGDKVTGLLAGSQYAETIYTPAACSY